MGAGDMLGGFAKGFTAMEGIKKLSDKGDKSKKFTPKGATPMGHDADAADNANPNPQNYADGGLVEPAPSLSTCHPCDETHVGLKSYGWQRQNFKK
jgi:hypothetical protein